MFLGLAGLDLLTSLSCHITSGCLDDVMNITVLPVSLRFVNKWKHDYASNWSY